MRIIQCTIVLMIGAAPGTIVAETLPDWTDFPNPAFELDGLPWYSENAPDLFRFPKRIQDHIPKGLWGLAQQTSGVRIRFRSNCTTLGIRLLYPGLSGMRNMHVFGQSGVDLYADGRYIGTATHQDEEEVEHIFFNDATAEWREFTLYLPLYNGVQVQSIGSNPEAEFKNPRPYARSKPVVFYGTSITQGGCASRAGMSYEAILSRTLNIDFVNLGFSGSGKGEPVVAQTIAELDPACFVLDFMANNKTVESIEQVYAPFVRTLREKHPTTPIVCITLISVCGESPLRGARERIEGMRDVIRGVVAERIAAGDENLILVEGESLLGPDLVDGHVDGTHPNDLGFQIMADRLAPTLAQILGLPQPRTLFH